MSGPPTPLVLGTFSPSVLLRTARRTGVLDRHGLAVEERPVPSSPAQFAALEAGSLDAALTSPDNVVAYRFLPGNPLGSTRDVRIVSAVDRGLGLALYAGPGPDGSAAGLEGIAALRGQVVGVDVAASGFAFALFEILGRAGLRRDDYELAELGSTPKRLDALLEGRCAATMLNAGNDLKADDAGLVRLADVTSVAAPYLGTVLAVQGEPTPAVRSLAAALVETGEAVRPASRRISRSVTSTACSTPTTGWSRAASSTRRRSRRWSTCGDGTCHQRWLLCSTGRATRRTAWSMTASARRGEHYAAERAPADLA
jgi:ABC-type nitrate/sulfonate/bicarbonate transport system substrate-binding protein